MTAAGVERTVRARSAVVRGSAALALGLTVPLSLAPFGWWPLALLGIAGLLYLLRDAQSLRGAIWLGLAFGFGKYGVGVSWVYVSIHEYGHASVPLSVAMVLLFVAVLALLNAALALLWYRFLRSTGVPGDLGWVALWCALDWFTTWFLTGFPWLFVGYGHLHTPLAGYAPLLGVHGVTLAAAVSAVLLLRWLLRPRQPWPVLAAVVLIWVAGFVLQQIAWVSPVRSVNVALVQGNIDQAVKWSPAQVQHIIDTYTRLTEPVWNREIVMWPEAAITLFLDEAGPLLAALGQRARANGGTLVTGIVSYRPDEGIRNLTVAVGNGEGVYAKRRLVPFGEYVPLEAQLRGLIEFFDLPMSHTRPGLADQPLLRAGELSVAMAICYEVVYPDLMREQGKHADLLATVSNDTWFGRSIGPLQHLEMAQMRALELGRYLLRATNNGVTAIVDSRGTIAAQLPQFEDGVLTGQATVMRGQTPFAWWGSYPTFAIVLVLLVLSAVARGRAVGRP